jgi:hypothetical protein
MTERGYLSQLEAVRPPSAELQEERLHDERG